MTEQKVLFIDPGGTTGWAIFDIDTAKIVGTGQEKGLDEFVDTITLLHEFHEFITVVYEDYSLDNKATHNMNKYQKAGHQDTLQVIGAIKSFCRVNHILVEAVPRDYKNAGYKYSKLPQASKSNHDDSHWRDAYAIGYHWLVKKGFLRVPRRPIIEEQDEHRK